MSETGKKVVFLVDDDELYLSMLQVHIVNVHDYEVRVFSTGEDCVKELLHTHPSIIILDYSLNSTFKDALNGLQILDIIRKLDKHVHVIMLSSQERYGIALQTIQHGAERYVIKGPDSFAEIDAIVEVLQ